ncbi:50S ribosomal protein L19 [candidate division KD3-62 bacterium DG_56]|uniref:Large ribosomal subunit protein bL19 n=1 Tax=candidate division KD3-62 bacterium DG_56 TaxID=1704032 RepID=A0A0S7XKS0_9BACT|nr:MAG: 50S ribosomal protein L19 [candidate division KD3-62 bacterium DG_56]
MAGNIVAEIEREQLKSDVPDFGPGDTVRVHVRVIEGNRERIQVYEGIVLRRSGGGLRERFTVRRVTRGVGVERTFLAHSPRIDNIEVRRRARVRRARLYYLRRRVGKATRIKEDRRAR